MARQGDILIIPVDYIPEGARPVPRRNGRIILAEGEATGHAHVILDEGVELLTISEQADRWLRVQTPVPVAHDEHNASLLTTGLHMVRGQLEYHPKELRRVAD